MHSYEVGKAEALTHTLQKRKQRLGMARSGDGKAVLGLRARVSTCACTCVKKFRCGLMARLTRLGHSLISRKVPDITALGRRAAGSKTECPVLLAFFLAPGTTVPS